MLEMTFYPLNKQTPYTIELASDLLYWLAQSDFMEIGGEHPTEIEIDGEIVTLELVNLGKGNSSNRKRLRDFLLEAIAQESDTVLTKLNNTFDKQEYQAITYKLRKLQELRKSVENETYQYLQRV